MGLMHFGQPFIKRVTSTGVCNVRDVADVNPHVAKVKSRRLYRLHKATRDMPCERRWINNRSLREKRYHDLERHVCC